LLLPQQDLFANFINYLLVKCIVDGTAAGCSAMECDILPVASTRGRTDLILLRKAQPQS
jgi:hypothetical protein